MGAKVLADGKTKFTVLTTKPANPAAPTAAELNAGIHLSDHVLTSDFTFGATDSDKFAEKAQAFSDKIARNAWVYPTDPVVLTARFGEYGLWSSYHTGLDFNGNTGDPIVAVAGGTVTSVGYDGSYGNKTVITLDDGTEIWYCHQNSYNVSEGDVVRAGELIGTIGATGHVTGSHLHLEVRPGAGDPVDPYAAMVVHGLFR